MNNSKIFFVKYPTGCIKVYVENFFCGAVQTSINRLLKLAKTYSTEEQRVNLLSDLEEVKQEIDARNYSNLSTKVKRIEQYIEKIKKQKWGS